MHPLLQLLYACSGSSDQHQRRFQSSAKLLYCLDRPVASFVQGIHIFPTLTPGAPQVHTESYVPNTGPRGATSGRSYLHNTEDATSIVSRGIVYVCSFVVKYIHLIIQ